MVEVALKSALIWLCLQHGTAAFAAVVDCSKITDEAQKADCSTAVEMARQSRTETKVIFGNELDVVGCDPKIIKEKLKNPKDASVAFTQATCELATHFKDIVGLDVDSSQPAKIPLSNIGEAIQPAKISLSKIDEVLEILRGSMKLGLKGLEMGLAQYFEFFLEGQRASYYYRKFVDADEARNIKERLLFCSARRNAQTLLDRVDWTTVVFNFDGEKHADLNTTLPRMAADLMNESGPLAESKGPDCLEISGFAETDIQSAISRSLDAAIKPYFASTSPIGGMIQRRVDRLAAPAAALTVKAEDLRERVAEQVEFLGKVKNLTAKAIEDADREVEKYQESFKITTAVARWFERFNDGLFLAPSGENTLLVLRETYDRVYDPRCGSLASALGRTSGTELCKASPSTAITKEGTTQSIIDLANQLATFKRNFESSFVSEKTYDSATRYLCGVYYCQILPDDGDASSFRQQLLTKYCRSTVNKQLCLPPATAADGKFKVTVGNVVRTQGVEDICKAAKFSSKWMKSKLEPAEASNCLQAMTTSAFSP